MAEERIGLDVYDLLLQGITGMTGIVVSSLGLLNSINIK